MWVEVLADVLAEMLAEMLAEVVVETLGKMAEVVCSNANADQTLESYSSQVMCRH